MNSELEMGILDSEWRECEYDHDSHCHFLPLPLPTTATSYHYHYHSNSISWCHAWDEVNKVGLWRVPRRDSSSKEHNERASDTNFLGKKSLFLRTQLEAEKSW